LNAVGDVVAIGAIGNDGAGTDAGHARIYQWNTTAWNQLGDDIDGEIAGDNSGYSVSLNAVGDVVAVGARLNDNNGNSNTGHARVYHWNSTAWNQLGDDIDGELANDWLGQSVSLNNDGDVIAVGVPGYDGPSSNSGAVRVYVLAADEPSISPTSNPSVYPSDGPSVLPSDEPSVMPSDEPSTTPSVEPSVMPSNNPSMLPPLVITSSGGDPHFIGFNQKLVTFQGECTLILLDSPSATARGEDVTVHIRTTRKLDFSYISGVAMKIADDVVEIKPDGTLFLNKHLISDDITRMSGLPFVCKKEMKGKMKMIVSYSFDLGHGRMIDIRANKRSNMMFISTKGHFSEATQGMLGSPGHDELVSRDGRNLSEIDVNAYGESWQVKNDDMKLFMEPIGPQYPQRCLYEDAPGATSQLHVRRRLMEKKVIELEEAKAACSNVSSTVKRELCIQDTIAMGDLEVKDDPFYLE
jgi:hypothetical protein